MSSFLSPASSQLRSGWLFAFLAVLSLPASVVAAESAAAANATAPIILSTDEMVKVELLNLDKVLEADPKLEEKLRLNLDQLLDAKYRANNPDVDALLRSRPAVVPALAKERRFLLHRAIVRMAHAPVVRRDIVQLDEFLDAHLDIQRALEKRPRQIVESSFLIAHPTLAQFFEKHPGLSTALLENAEKRATNKAANPKK
jgi:hypothetical protein